MQLQLTTQDGKVIGAYRAGQPDAAKGLVVLQEIFGVNSHIREVVDRYAAEGYDVIAPALFDRVTPNVELGYSQDDIKEGLDLRAKLTLEDSLSDIRAAIAELGDKPIGIVGFCWGGALAWHAACKVDGLNAASCWYGGGIASALDQTPKIPVQMHFGDKDASIPMSDVEAIRQAQPGIEVHVYSDAEHGFGCDHRATYNEAAYKLALERTLKFFSQHLS